MKKQIKKQQSDRGFLLFVSAVTALVLLQAPLSAFADEPRYTDPTGDLVWLEHDTLLASDEVAKSKFGHAVDVSGIYAIVGARSDPVNARDSGSAYIYERTENGWIGKQKLVPSDGAPGDNFGHSVSIFGDTALVGAYSGNDKGSASGAVYVFGFSQGVWKEQQKLLPSDGVRKAQFGYSVELAGDTALIGAPGDGTEIWQSGSVYVFSRSKDTWEERQKLVASDREKGDHFGASVSLTVDTILVGARSDDDNGLDAGSAYVFVRSGNTWEEQQKLLPGNGQAGALFGYNVSLSGPFALISAHGDEWGVQGTAYIFVRNGDTWEEQQELLPEDGGSGGALYARGIALSGGMAMVGAPNEIPASVYVFKRINKGWKQWQKLSPDSLDVPGFGVSIAIQGHVAVIGSTRLGYEESEFGSAHIFLLRSPFDDGEFCSENVQCDSGFCVDGVCCESRCGGGDELDCRGCSIDVGSSEDGVCEDLSGTACDDGDDYTTDDMCVEGACGTEADYYDAADSDPDIDPGDHSEVFEADLDYSAAGCSAVGPTGRSGLFGLLGLLLN